MNIHIKLFAERYCTFGLRVIDCVHMFFVHFVLNLYGEKIRSERVEIFYILRNPVLNIQDTVAP